jgi:hypothetical protein
MAIKSISRLSLCLILSSSLVLSGCSQDSGATIDNSDNSSPVEVSPSEEGSTTETETVCVSNCEIYAELTGDGLYELVLSRIRESNSGFPKTVSLGSVDPFIQAELGGLTSEGTLVALAPKVYTTYSASDTDFRFAIEEARLAGECGEIRKLWGVAAKRDNICAVTISPGTED